MGRNSASSAYCTFNAPSGSTSWERWWAWYPVRTVSGQRVWFTWCYRRLAIYGMLWVVEDYEREFATVFDVITHPDN